MPAAKTVKNAATTPARPAIRQRQLPNATTQSATNAEIPLLQKRNAETTATTATQPAQAAV